MSDTYTYDFNKAMVTLRGCLQADSYLASAMALLTKNANVTVVRENAYRDYLTAKEQGEEPAEIETQPIDYPVKESYRWQYDYLKDLCQKKKGEAGMLLIRKEANSPAYGMKYDEDTHGFVLSEEPLIPSAKEYAQVVERLKKPLPPAPNFFQKVGHFFSTLFGGAGNAAVNKYNRALDENEAIVYNGMHDAGYKVEKSEAVLRWEETVKKERVAEEPKKQENKVQPIHEKPSPEQQLESRKKIFLDDLAKRYPDEKDADFVNEMSEILNHGTPEVRQYILTLKHTAPNEQDPLDTLAEYYRSHTKPGALREHLSWCAGMKQQQNLRQNQPQNQPQDLQQNQQPVEIQQQVKVPY